MSTELRSHISGILKVEAQIDGSKLQPAGGADYPRLLIPLYITVKGIEPKHRNDIYSAQFGTIQSELLFNGQKIRVC